jgi:hypothetical protein
LPDSLIHGDYLLQLGVFYMATLSCRHDLWPEGKATPGADDDTSSTSMVEAFCWILGGMLRPFSPKWSRPR